LETERVSRFVIAVIINAVGNHGTQSITLSGPLDADRLGGKPDSVENLSALRNRAKFSQPFRLEKDLFERNRDEYQVVIKIMGII
jgi:hypothetical protein